MVSVFPGSALYSRGEPQRKPILKGNKPPTKPTSSQPQWIVAGEIVETGISHQVLTRPVHPYTRTLLAAVPSLRTDRNQPLAVI